MKKTILSEQSLFFGEVLMPKGFEINSLELSKSILDSLYVNKSFLLSKDWDKLNTYVMEHTKLEHNLSLINTKSWGNIYTPDEKTELISHVDLMDLKHSPDYILLYGINTVDCFVEIFYDDSRRKGKSHTIKLKDNMFIMFPSTNMYKINNNQKNSLNFIETITYEYM